MSDNQSALVYLKLACIVVMFVIKIVMGRLPLKSKAFRTNQIVLSLAQSFSGGLFLAVGMIHLLPESSSKFQEYYTTQGTQDTEEIFPMPYLITVGSFSLILFIEKILTNHQHSHEEHGNMPHHESQEKVLLKQDDVCCSQVEACCNQVENTDQENNLKKAVSTTVKLAQRISFVQNKQSTIEIKELSQIQTRQPNSLAPYLLQIAVGIHAVFEGMAIGIETNLQKCIGISLAVMCHKWAEGLTLGLAFKQAGVGYTTAMIMIVMQAAMNPIGIIMGWVISGEGSLIVGIFYAISAGTFFYIATIEVIVVEFNIARFKCFKFLMYLLAIGFICGVWYIEQMSF